jgi:hypothetical protein
MQANASSSAVPEESRARDFALDLLNDLVASDARSSSWDAQVELLTDFVKAGGRQKAKDCVEASSREVKDARTRTRPQRSVERTPFVPMS